ncbi:cation-dependent mannose-6-phosphate receptor [Elysia marginata]|uniref:Cation-dependent mannose-6-phosphate receptor n=1 Tax=Elysia marginata TaxID=1093978 RepID=A0AAV4IXB8_9GAST|nr:cation-dependent mannose-6-phosphate receptor [Elysia marginata]
MNCSASKHFELAAEACCPVGGASAGQSEGLSVGSILLIVFVSLVFVYIVAGVAVQVGLKKADGKDRIPHVTFWIAVPGLIKDGIRFTFSCGKRKQYSDI